MPEADVLYRDCLRRLVHDLRSTLGAVRMAAELLSDSGESDIHSILQRQAGETFALLDLYAKMAHVGMPERSLDEVLSVALEEVVEASVDGSVISAPALRGDGEAHEADALGTDPGLVRVLATLAHTRGGSAVWDPSAGTVTLDLPSAPG